MRPQNLEKIITALLNNRYWSKLLLKVGFPFIAIVFLGGSLIIYNPKILPLLGVEKKYGVSALGSDTNLAHFKFPIPGLKYAYFRKGDKLVINYDVKIRSGSLRVYLMKLACSLPFCPPDLFEKTEDIRYIYIKQDGAGKEEIIVRKDGMYRLSISQSNLGDKKDSIWGRDVSYTISWSVY